MAEPPEYPVCKKILRGLLSLIGELESCARYTGNLLGFARDLDVK